MPAPANMVWETTAETASPYTLTAVANSFNTAFGTGGTDTFVFFMRNRDVAGEWMYGTGHLSDATTLVVDTVSGGSNGTSEVAWSAGTKDVTNDVPAEDQLAGKGADIASASPLVLGADGNYFDVTGTTGFSAITVAAGRTFALQFDGALTMTHGASLVLPNAANYTTAAGDVYVFFATAANTCVCISYVNAEAGKAERDARLQWLYIADLWGDRLNMEDGIIDPFDDEDDVDTGASTGAAYNSETDLYAPSVSGSEANANAPSGSTLDWEDVTYVDRSWGVDNNATVLSIDIYSIAPATAHVKLFHEDSSTQFDVVVSESFSHGGTGWETKVLSSPYVVPASGTYRAGGHLYTGAGDNAGVQESTARAFKPGNVTGDDQSGFTADTNPQVAARVNYQTSNMDLRSNSFTADAQPDTARLGFPVGGTDIGTATLNTDILGYASRDGGTTWTQATLAAVRTLADGSVWVEDAAIDISGQPAGTSMKWRFATDNGVDLWVSAALEQWAQ